MKGEWRRAESEEQEGTNRRRQPAVLDETLEPPPAYLRSVTRLPRAVRRLLEAGDRRPLTTDEEQRIALAIAAACLRVLDARRRRDGKA